MANLTKLNYIQYLCEKRLKDLGLEKDSRYVLRLERELTNIDVQDLTDYVIKLIKAAITIEKHGSLVYYLLGVSKIDPIATNIDLAVKKLSSFPDIDSDFSINEREQVVKYFINKYGSDHVAPIGSYGQMKMKMVIRDVARIFDVDIHDTNEIAKNLSDEVDALTEEEFDAAIALEPGDENFVPALYELRKYFERHPEVRDIIFKLKGQLRHLTKHPAGVVATPGKIDESIPLMRHKNELITSWVDGIFRKDLQSSGFIKFDILGLKTLTIIKEILELIRSRKAYNKNADFDIESIDHGQYTSLLYEEFSSLLPLDGNDKIYEKFREADTNGVFQFECISGDSWIGNYRVRELYNKFTKDSKSVNKIGCVNIKRQCKIRQTIAAMKKKVATVYRIVVSKDNMCLESTMLHEYYTKRGWLKLQDIVVGDKVLIDQERCRTQYYCEAQNMTIDDPGVSDRCKHCTARKCTSQVLGKFKFYKQRYKFVTVKHIQLVGEKEVFDIGFGHEQHHNYVANGFVVHNSNLMKTLLKEIKPTTFADITTTTALGRPGPLDMGMHHEYTARKQGKGFNFGSPVIEKCLKESYGILVYQEDVMRLCNMVAGFPLDLTDTVRKNLMKSIRDTDARDKSVKERKKIHDMFIKGFEKNGLTEDIAESWWQSCVAFARYGFNKSHAVAYTILSYQMMWFKVYYPLEFFVVLFTNSPKEKFTGYFAEAMNKTINILPADISRSKDGFTIHSAENSIMFGLGHVVGVGPAIINVITQLQPFSSSDDFWQRTAAIKKIGKSAMTALINSHALDAFGSQNDLLDKYYKEIRGDTKWIRDVDYTDKRFEHEKFVEAYSLDWRTKLSEPQRLEITRLGAKLLTKLVQPRANFKRQVWGVITDIIKKTSKNGNEYYYVILTDSKFNIAKIRIPCYNRRCKKAFLLDHDLGKYKKVGIDDVIKMDNILVGEAETSEYMGRVFVDLVDICCIGNVYEKTIQQKERLAKYDDMFEKE